VCSEGPTSASLESGRLAVWTLDGHCGDVIYSEGPTSVPLDGGRVVVWILNSCYGVLRFKPRINILISILDLKVLLDYSL
jgi:hypothetical protein